ncbi:MAG: hypothetical protein H7145_22085 [Akkermansiaceae bacterium]|nr:hypothetical protein [Armatimonadota bacterium]
MQSLVFSRRQLITASLALSLSALSSSVRAQDIVTPRVLRQEKDGFTLTLRLPQSPVIANVEAVLYLRLEIEGTGESKQVVPFARVDATAKPDGEGNAVSLSASPDGVAGEYSIVGKFPAAGVYTITVTVSASSNSNAEPISVSFNPVRVLSVAEKDKEQSANYSLKVESTPSQPLPGELVKLRLFVTDNATKKRVTEFESIYNAPFHLYVVREDTSELRREKPVPVSAAPNSKEDGVFLLDYAFSSGGSWRLFAEVAPKDQGIQLLTTRMTIPGAKSLPEPMMAQIAPLVRQNGVNLRFSRPTRFIARETMSVPLQLEDGQGNGLADLQITDSALAHLYFAERDGKTFLHTVPDSRDPRNGRSGSNTLTFPVRFPKAGTYRAWLTLNRSGQPAVVTFVVRVYDK